MLRNYFIIAQRNMRRNALFSVINILGLAVGIACFLTLWLYVNNELSFDHYTGFWPTDRVYRVYVRQQISGESGTSSKTSGSLGPTLQQLIPEVEGYTRIGYYGPRAFIHGDNTFRTGGIYAVDSTFFNLFNLKFLAGNPSDALVKPHSLVLTERAARRIFGDTLALGAVLPVENGEPYQVTAVVENFPETSHFHADYLESMSTYQPNPSWLELWYSTYIVLRPGASAKEVEKKLQDVVASRVGPEAEKLLGVPMKQFLEQGNVYAFHLQPFSSIYLYSTRDYGIDPNTEWGNVSLSDATRTYILSAIALFILLLAVINFMNLATAKSEKRSREVGVRKTFGSGRVALMIQFIGEAVIMSFLALVVAIVLVSIMIPWFNDMINRQLELNWYSDPYTILGLLGLVLVVGILAGSYPAFFLSSFRPSQVLKGTNPAGGSSMLRSTLVVTQFAVSICLLIGSLVIKQQLDYIRNRNLGFNKEYLLSISNANVLRGQQEAFRESLLTNSAILSCTKVSRMFGTGIPGSGYLFDKQTGSDPILCQYVDVDYDFLRTYEIPLVDGRFFSRDFPSDVHAVVVNQAAARAFSADPVLNKNLFSLDANDRGEKFEIIGVIADFNYESLHSQVRPLVLHLRPPRQPAVSLTFRLAPGNLESTVQQVEDTWKKFSSEPMSFNFVDETIDRLYNSEQKTGLITSVFSGLAIFIACIGLFGLAAFVTGRRTKEIGIRKVLGASSSQVVGLLSREFATWVMLANLIAWPVAYYFMSNWLRDFAFRIDVPWSDFLLAGLATFIIAFLTVGIHAFRAAESNPVESLKSE